MSDLKNSQTYYKREGLAKINEVIIKVITSEACWMKIKKDLERLKRQLQADECRQVEKTVESISYSQKKYAEYVRDNMMCLDAKDVFNSIIRGNIS